MLHIIAHVSRYVSSVHSQLSEHAISNGMHRFILDGETSLVPDQRLLPARAPVEKEKRKLMLSRP